MSPIYPPQPSHGLNPTIDDHAAWQYRYWWWAALPMLVMFVFEALQISLFKTAQAPNVSSGVQITLMLAFFAVWIVVPRVIWLQLNKLSPDVTRRVVLLRLGLVGVGLSILHLLLLAGLLRLMYSPPGWGFSHLLHSFAEVWLTYAGIWLLVYCLACIGVITIKRRYQAEQRSAEATAKLAVRHAGKTLFLAPDEIIWIEADGNYAKVHHHQQIYMVRQSLRSLERTLPTGMFVRTHRQALVNLDHVHSLQADSGSQSYRLQLKGNQQAPLSRRHLTAVKQYLQQGAHGTH